MPSVYLQVWEREERPPTVSDAESLLIIITIIISAMRGCQGVEEQRMGRLWSC